MWLTAIQIVIGVAVVVALFVVSRYFRLWLQGYSCGARIGIPSLVVMSLRKLDPRAVMDAKIMAIQAGLGNLPTAVFESHLMAGGDIRRVTLALIAAHRAGIALDWNTASAIDLAGRDVLDAVRVSVNPIVIDCPEPLPGAPRSVDGVSRDGIQLRVRARVTVRMDLAQLVGGATEATVIARVGQGIVTAIGSCDTYKMVLANPAMIAHEVLKKGLDSQTAFSIVSIDIADVEVGENIGATLQAAQAEADIRIARANAENRRAIAIAREQEMRAQTQQSRAAVALAEAEIPIQISAAFRRGAIRVRRAGAKAPPVRRSKI